MKAGLSPEKKEEMSETAPRPMYQRRDRLLNRQGLVDNNANILLTDAVANQMASDLGSASLGIAL